jgi:hypothetical protein
MSSETHTNDLRIGPLRIKQSCPGCKIVLWQFEMTDPPLEEGSSYLVQEFLDWDELEVWISDIILTVCIHKVEKQSKHVDR